MEPEKVLDLGSKYSKKDLSSLLDQPNLSFVREGIFNCKNSSSSLFFVDLEKKDKEKKFHFNDFLKEIFFIGTLKQHKISIVLKYKKL